MLKDYGNYCPEIYRSVFVDKFNDNHVRVAPCCQAKSELEPVENFNFTTSPYLNYLRKQFDLGHKPDACARCWVQEQNGNKSRRQSAIEFFDCVNIDRKVELQSIDHSATWACNLACIMCDEKSSSFWAKQSRLDKTQLSNLGRLFQRSNNIFQKLDLAHVRKIHFNGGEPMLNDDQFDLLLKLEKQKVLKDLFISYNTNATVMPSKKIINLWSRARLVKIFFSVDAIGPAFEYIRWPAKWSETEENILEMKQKLPSNVMFGFNCTIGSYNLLEMPKVYQWFFDNIKQNREGDTSDFCWQLANNFAVGNLSKTIKSKAIERLRPIAEFSGLISHLESTINCVEDKKWLTTLDNLDANRNTDWKKSLEISNFIEVENC